MEFMMSLKNKQLIFWCKSKGKPNISKLAKFVEIARDRSNKYTGTIISV